MLAEYEIFVRALEEGSLSAAARRLDLSPAVASRRLARLEDRLGVRLLTRTTRSVRPTAAGERLLQTVAPQFEAIEAELKAVGELRDKPAGTVRITEITAAPSAKRTP